MQTCTDDTICLRSNRNYHGEWSRGRENVELWPEVCPGGNNGLKCVLFGFRLLSTMWFNGLYIRLHAGLVIVLNILLQLNSQKIVYLPDG